MPSSSMNMTPVAVAKPAPKPVPKEAPKATGLRRRAAAISRAAARASCMVHGFVATTA